MLADPRNGASIVSFGVACLYRADAIRKVTDAVRFQERHRAPPNQMIGRIQRRLDRVIRLFGFLFGERIEDRERGVVESLVLQCRG